MEFRSAFLDALLASLALPGENRAKSVTHTSVALGVAQRWPVQEIAENATVCLTVDADLTNWQDIVAHLESKGINAGQMMRGEALVELYLLNGIDFLKRLEGGFAIALWDAKIRRLILAVDPLGIKPLYFGREGNRLLFSSRVSAIRAAQERPTEVNSAAIMQYLIFSAVTAPLHSTMASVK